MMQESKCLPMLSGQKLLIRILALKKDATSKLILVGDTGNEFFIFHCALNAAAQAKIKRSPENYTIGKDVFITGKADRYVEKKIITEPDVTDEETYNRFELSNCSVSP